MRRTLTGYVHRYERQYGVTVDLTVFEDGDELVSALPAVYDMVFLDIQMKRMDGMETARRLRKVDREASLVFLTNMAQFAIQGYEVAASNYLLKPVPYFAFARELKKAADRLEQRRAAYLNLTNREEELLELVCANFDKVLVVYNGANAMELGFVEQYKQIKGVLWCPGAGQSAFEALGEILSGAVNPSGRTPDTFVYDLTAAPNFNNIGSFVYTNMTEFPGDNFGTPTTPTFVNYVEGIYVGYRFYETAAAEGFLDYDKAVQYPFGYGLSYTTFTQEMSDISVSGTGLSIDVTVTNTGNVAGKDVVEVYYNPPYTNGGIEKSAVNLVEYAKTGLLQPGESETVTITFDEEDMASYDASGAGCYVLEQGDYVISINSDSHTVLDSRTYTVDKTIRYTDGRTSDDTAAANQFAFAKGDVTYLSRADGFANYVEVTAAPATLVLADSYKDTFVNNLNYDPAAFNGPASINNNFTGMGSIGFPSAVMIAATWNTDLATRFGESIGKMADEMGVSGWYAPAINVHCSAFAGRNFEYYSEDGVLGGKTAAHAVAGAKEYGVYAYIKHFALNDQETNRNSMLCTWSNEQAIREIYLKAFELAVKEGGAGAVMSAFNYIGTTYAGSCSALLNSVLRDEWGFRGMVLTDYYGVYGYQDADNCIRNGNDCCLVNYDTETNHVSDQTSATSIKAMRQACKNMLYTVVNSRAYAEENLNPGMPAWQIAAIVADVLLAALVLFLERKTVKVYKKRRQ